MLLFLYFLEIPQIFTVNVAKLEIPYEYLATRARPNISNYNMSDLFTSDIQEAYNSNCNSTRCYFPVFNDSGVLKYTILTDLNSTCITLPNCLGFTEEQYQNYTIVFGNPSIQDDNLKDGRSYEVAKCDSEYFSFTRANGLNWCGEIVKETVTHSDAGNLCETGGKHLNGFQFIEEQEAFLNFSLSSGISTFLYIHLGASKSSESVMTWSESIVSTNQSLASNLPTWHFNNDPVFLVLFFYDTTMSYLIVGNEKEAYYSCGWYAT